MIKVTPEPTRVGGFLRLPQVLKLIPVAPSTWWAWVKQGRAPAPVKLGPRTTAWRAEEIHDYIESFPIN